MATAVRAGPTLYRGIKDLDDDDARAAELKERLVAKGYEIEGAAPTVSNSAWELTRIHAFREKAVAVSRRSVPRRPRK